MRTVLEWIQQAGKAQSTRVLKQGRDDAAKTSFLTGRFRGEEVEVVQAGSA